jgi:hypothetical protein
MQRCDHEKRCCLLPLQAAARGRTRVWPSGTDAPFTGALTERSLRIKQELQMLAVLPAYACLPAHQSVSQQVASQMQHG